MIDPTSVISLIVFAPALFLLYFILGKYDIYFKHNKAFFMIAIGLGFGLVVGFFSLYLPIEEFFWTLAIVFFIELTKMLILLQKPFRLKHDSTFYGMSLGIGIAAMFTFVNTYSSGISISSIIFIFLISYNYMLINSSTGALIGYGAYKGEFWRYLMRAFILHGGLGFFMSLVWKGQFSETGSYALLIVGAIYSTVVFIYVYNEILEKTIPEKLKKLVNEKDSEKKEVLE